MAAFIAVVITFLFLYQTSHLSSNLLSNMLGIKSACFTGSVVGWYWVYRVMIVC